MQSIYKPKKDLSPLAQKAREQYEADLRTQNYPFLEDNEFGENTYVYGYLRAAKDLEKIYGIQVEMLLNKIKRLELELLSVPTLERQIS